MAILKIYGASQTTSTRRVGTVLYEAKVPFELIEVDFKNGQHKTSAHLQKQPFGLIPYIDDDGFILYEARAICRYIAAKYPDTCRLIPTEWETRAKPRMGLKTDQAVVDKEIATLDKKLEAYDAILAKQKYLAGDAPLVAATGSDVMTRRPNVARWYNELVSRPSWLACKDEVKTTLEY
ncbi:thioredoxin-like protein [Mycena epipterygia]|nr:thioredoxin-like protein [Mycena epipterygia]